MSKNPFLEIDREILADSGTSCTSAEYLSVLCDQIGPRFVGTDGHRRAAEYMLDRFKEFQLENAELEPFEFTAWRRGEPAAFTMLEPVNRPIACYAMPYSGGTVPEGVTASILHVGSGDLSEIDAVQDQVKGRFVLTDGTGTHRTAIFQRCSILGAAGLLISNPVEGEILHTGGVNSDGEGAIPAVSIGNESGQYLLRMAKRGELLLKLVVHAAFEPATTWNVVGELTGSEFPDELVIMGGHIDSHEIGPCAFDNAAGAVQVMEAARLLARQRHHLKRTIRFIGFSAEEIGLLGSHYHAKAHAGELAKARFMLNSDCPSQGRPRGLGFHECPEGAAYINLISEQMDTPLVCQNRSHCHSDHYPFILQGLPTAGMAGGPFARPVQHYVHMAADTPEKISITDLHDGAAFAARFLLRAANDDAWPVPRRSPEEVETWRNK